MFALFPAAADVEASTVHILDTSRGLLFPQE